MARGVGGISPLGTIQPPGVSSHCFNKAWIQSGSPACSPLRHPARREPTLMLQCCRDQEGCFHGQHFMTGPVHHGRFHLLKTQVLAIAQGMVPGHGDQWFDPGGVLAEKLGRWPNPGCLGAGWTGDLTQNSSGPAVSPANHPQRRNHCERCDSALSQDACRRAQ